MRSRDAQQAERSEAEGASRAKHGRSRDAQQAERSEAEGASRAKP